MRTFNQNNAIRNAGTPDNYTAGTYRGPWIDLSQVGRRITLIGHPGPAMGGNIVMSLREAQNTNGLGAQAMAAPAAQTFVAGTDDGLPGVIEVRAEDFSSNAYDCIQVQWVAAGTVDFAVVGIISQLYRYPAVNTPNTHVAFVAGE